VEKQGSTASIRPVDDDFTWQEHSTRPGLVSAYRVLVAEDDQALRQLMAYLLAFEGYFVTEASDAQAMLDAVRDSQGNCELHFDLIVTDVRMPGLSGLDALARLRKSGCQVPAIVISALPGEMVRPEAEELNALFLPKPFALENLRRIANRVVKCNQRQG
jgi:DNA-binding response OmpR family regulator